MPLSLSVVICTHNPRLDVLAQTLDSLKRLTAPALPWELLLVDNASTPPLASRVDLSWHPDARMIIESKLGLTHARLAGFDGVRGDIVIYVDDDNILDTKYLINVERLAAEHPQLGVWGAGQITPRFEAPPPEWTKQYWYLLALRDEPADRVAMKRQEAWVPVGAGMCVRRAVLEHYSLLARAEPLRLRLDPIGNLLNRAGDQDLAYSAFDLGLGTGVFPALRLQHLIPPGRLTEEYLARLVEGYVYSNTILAHLYELPCSRPGGLWKRTLQQLKAGLLPARQRRFYKASLQGQARAWTDLARAAEQGSEDCSSVPPAPGA
jgi:glycosyltransferase involved in cell wall biosynthesis